MVRNRMLYYLPLLTSQPFPR